ncbi:MAG TPA: hypothetical protein DHW65_06415 [Dehalococcoidia bacterium]|nr:redoxin domain-containing protein [SAR202 cluster bacterium]HAA96004.1 hypothetical protein [Dehalococcoidia bacterium]HCL25961.1 hypothetical protein [Dehalococcoidia bacterium]
MSGCQADAQFSLIGRIAPDFTLPNPEGEPCSLQSLKGNKTLLVFLRHFA